MAQRKVAVRLASVRWEFSFTLTCHPDARFTEGQTFEIISPGCNPVRGHIMTGQVVNRSDGTTSVRMLADDRDKETNLRALRALPNVSDIQVVRD